jgi:hypothetical protein
MMVAWGLIYGGSMLLALTTMILLTRQTKHTDRHSIELTRRRLASADSPFVGLQLKRRQSTAIRVVRWRFGLIRDWRGVKAWAPAVAKASLLRCATSPVHRIATAFMRWGHSVGVEKLLPLIRT